MTVLISLPDQFGAQALAVQRASGHAR